MDFNRIWCNIIEHQGETFYTQARHRPCSYVVKNDYLHLKNTNRAIPRWQIEEALKIDDVKYSDLDKLKFQGPSYILAIISDKRIIG